MRGVPSSRYRLQSMARRTTLAVLGACAIAAGSLADAGGAAAMGAAYVPPTTVDAEEGGNPINDQGSSYDYRSNITQIAPAVPGLSVEVLEFADRLLLSNHTGKTVTIYGYEGEPYARVLANGTAEQNVRAPATYLNTNFYADVTVPVERQCEGAPAVGSGGPHGPVRMARPPHPLDVAGGARVGQEQEQAHADLRLAGADRRRRGPRARSTGSCSGRPRARARRSRRSSWASRSPSPGSRSWCSCAGAARAPPAAVGRDHEHGLGASPGEAW